MNGYGVIGLDWIGYEPGSSTELGLFLDLELDFGHLDWILLSTELTT